MFGAPNTTNSQRLMFAGHLGTSNYLFCDGHVKSLRPTRTIAGGVNMWMRDNTATLDSGLVDRLSGAEAFYNK